MEPGGGSLDTVAGGGDLKEVILELQCEGHSCHDPREGHLGSCDS